MRFDLQQLISVNPTESWGRRRPDFGILRSEAGPWLSSQGGHLAHYPEVVMNHLSVQPGPCSAAIKAHSEDSALWLAGN